MTENDINRPVNYKIKPIRNQVSRFRNGVWQFIDPQSLTWTPVDNFLSTHSSKDPLAILLSNARLPTEHLEVVNPGEKILRDSSSGTYLYFKHKPGQELL